MMGCLKDVAEGEVDGAARVGQAQRRSAALNQRVEAEGIVGKDQAARQVDHRQLQTELGTDGDSQQAVGFLDQAEALVEAGALA